MKRLITLTATILAFATSAYSQGQHGTEAEAKAMLDKATAAVKSNKAGALESMRKGEGGAVDRDFTSSVPTPATLASQSTPRCWARTLGKSRTRTARLWARRC